MRMTARAWPLLIVAVVLAAFYPAFFGEICNIDDAGMVEPLRQVTDWRLRDLFLPGGSGGLYYRPLLGLSFLINKSLFGLSAFSLHTENVLFHLANTLLVFYLIRLVLRAHGEETHPGYAFVGAMLFGVHPIVTESVNWISGRTDLFMGFFLLLSVVCLVHYRISGRKVLPWLAAFCFLCALLCKELAIAFLPGYFLILAARIDAPGMQSAAPVSWRKQLLIVAVVAVLVIGTFLLLRSLAFSSNSSRIGLTLQFIQVNPEHSLFLFLRAIGFYLKKLVLPWPLNFAIVDVDPLYDLAAIPLLAGCLYIALRNTMASALFIGGLFLFSPALLIALNQIAWTPYAERYIYTTTAFASIALLVYCARRPLFADRRWRYGLAAAVLVPALVTTVQRNVIWQKNERILADTAAKSPLFSNIQWLYASELYDQGEYEQALVYCEKAVKLPGSPLFYNPRREVALGYIYLHFERIPEAIATFKAVIRKSDDKSPEAHEGLVECYQRLWSRAAEGEQKREYLLALQTHADTFFRLRPDPMVYYNLGKRAMAGKAHEEAGGFFRQAVSHMPETHEYFPFAKKLAGRFPPRT